MSEIQSLPRYHERIDVVKLYIQKEYERLKQLGVEFTMEPTNMGMTTVAVFDNTCGNLIQLYQVAAALG
jgi:hypothetical protein